MSEQPTQAPPPEAQLIQLLFSKMVFFSLTAVARLGIADHLTEAPIDITQLARNTATNADALARVLRVLASLGVLSEPQHDQFALTPVGALLRTDHPHSMRGLAVMFSDPWQVQSFAQMEQVIRTGTDGPTLIFGEHAFDYFAKHPDEAANFHHAMTSFSTSAMDAILQVADFSRFHRMADCGGGHGLVISKVAQKYPNLQGVLYDLPEVVAGAPAAGFISQVEGRVHVEAGSFFERVPEGCDAYLMKHIIHDWSDADGRTILSLMREQLVKTAPDTGRVFLAEMVVPETPGPAPARMLDMEMLVCTRGGRERTHAQFSELFRSAGLRLVSITPTQSPMCLIEAAVDPRA
jgi:hypothetical protein